MRDPKYRRWLTGLPCLISAILIRHIGEAGVYSTQLEPTDPAHTQNNGTSSKGPDSSCVPLCRIHHREYDAGRAAFEAKYGVDMKVLAAEYYNRYLTENGTKAGLPPAEQGETIES